MPFLLQNLSRCQEANNAGIGSLGAGGNALFSYSSVLELIATISAVDYFVPAIFQLELGDLILIRGSDGVALLEVTVLVKTGGALSITTAAVAL